MGFTKSSSDGSCGAIDGGWLSGRAAGSVHALAYAFYIGIAVSMTIHWFSDFVAGAIIGTVIGLVVGTSFRAEV